MAMDEEIKQRLQELQKQFLPQDSFSYKIIQHFLSNNRFIYLKGILQLNREPPQPDWLVLSYLLTAAATLYNGEPSGEQINTNSDDRASNLLRELMERLDTVVPEFLDDYSGVPRAPPASKEVLAKLLVATITDFF